VTESTVQGAIRSEWHALYKGYNTGNGYARMASFAARKTPYGFACPAMSAQTRSRRASRKALIRSAGNAGQTVFGVSRKKPGRSAAARVSPLGKDAAIPGEACLTAKRFPTR